MICRVSAFWTSATQSWFGVRDVDRIKGQLIDAMRCRRTRALTGGPRRCLLLLSLSAISPYRAYYKATGHSSVTRRLSCDQGAPFRINEHNKHLWFHGFVLVTLKNNLRFGLRYYCSGFLLIICTCFVFISAFLWKLRYLWCRNVLNLQQFRFNSVRVDEVAIKRDLRFMFKKDIGWHTKSSSKCML